MSKKQNNIFNFIPILLVSLLIITYSNARAEKSVELAKADSLFRLQKYTESFEIYEQILNENNEASPQMLMKMAFIKEGLGDYSQALIYLNKYYLQTSDKRAQNKMQELAEEHELNGFALTDTKFFKGLINKYYLEFNFILFGTALLFGFVAVYRKMKARPNSVSFAISAACVLLVLFWIINFELNEPQGIIIENHAYLMTGPSAGADLIDVVSKGHRLKILDEEGIWIKVRWNDQEAYIRSSLIKRIS